MSTVTISTNPKSQAQRAPRSRAAQNKAPQKPNPKKRLARAEKRIRRLNSVRGRDNKAAFKMNLTSSVFDGLSADCAAYAMTMLNPLNFITRVPASNGAKTAIVRSTREVLISPVVTADGNNGRFSLCMQPIFGVASSSDADINKYQLAIIDANSNNNSWNSTLFGTAASYNTNTNGSDPRLDKNYSQLCAQQACLYHGLNDPGILVGDSPFGPAAATGPETYNVLPAYTQSSVTSNWTIPPGQWLITLSFDKIPAANFPITYGGSGSATSITVVDDQEPGTGVNGSASIVVLLTTDGSPLNNVFHVSYTGAGAVSIPPGYQTDMTLTPALSDITPSFANSGIVLKYRPLGMSMLATCLAPDFTNGGQICSAYTPAEQCSRSYFTDAPEAAYGFLQNAENLATRPGAYSGEFKHGTYVWWAPESQSDREFYTPEVGNARDWPCLIVSGKYIQPTGTSVPAPQLRVLTTIDYEITTESELLERRSSFGTNECVDRALICVNTMPHAMANAEHLPFLRRAWESILRAMKTGTRFYGENKSWIDPALRGMAISAGLPFGI